MIVINVIISYFCQGDKKVPTELYKEEKKLKM